MVCYSFYPVFVAVVDVAALDGGATTCGVPADGLHKIFVFIIKPTGVCHKFYVGAEERDGIEDLDALAFFVMDVFSGVGKPRPHGSR